MKKVLIIVMVALFIVGGVSFNSEAYLLETNSEWKIRVTNILGQYIDIYKLGDSIYYYSYDMEIDARHHTLYYKVVKKNDWENDSDDEIIFQGSNNIGDGERARNNPGINMTLNSTGFYTVTLELNTGNRATSVIYLYDSEKVNGKEEFEWLNWISDEKFYNFLEEYN